MLGSFKSNPVSQEGSEKNVIPKSPEEMLASKLSYQQQSPFVQYKSSKFHFGQFVIPIDDFYDAGDKYSKIERQLRCKLAAVYRLIDFYGWSENIYNHVTVRVCEDLDHFLLNPFGLQYHEVTASSLLKVDMQGNVIDSGSTAFHFNRAGFILHSAVHSARRDVRCVIHIHYPPCIAVSAMKCGLLPVCQEAALIGDVSYHDYHGIVVDTQERDMIAKDLGSENKVMILRNHGVLVCGGSIEEALFYLHNFILACETQIRLIPAGLNNIQLMDYDARMKVRNIIAENHGTVLGKPGEEEDDKNEIPQNFRIWDLEFQAQMRMLENSRIHVSHSECFNKGAACRSKEKD